MKISQDGEKRNTIKLFGREYSKVKFLLSGLGAFVLIIFVSSFGVESSPNSDVIIVEPTPTSERRVARDNEVSEPKPVAKSSILKVGDEGIVNDNDNPQNCEEKTTFGVTDDDLSASINAQIANDKQGYMKLAGYGRIFFVENCTPILVLERGGTLSSMAKVRILEHHSYAGQTGWIPYEFAVRK